MEKKEAVIANRIKPSVKAKAEKLARAEGRSLANYLEQLIEPATGRFTTLRHRPRRIGSARLAQEAEG